MEVGGSIRCTTVLSGLNKAGRGAGAGVGDPEILEVFMMAEDSHRRES